MSELRISVTLSPDQVKFIDMWRGTRPNSLSRARAVNHMVDAFLESYTSVLPNTECTDKEHDDIWDRLTDRCGKPWS